MSPYLPQATYNTLIQRSIDLLGLYRRAACACEPGLKVVLSENAQTLDTMIADLQHQLRASGASPRESGTVVGTLRGHLSNAIAKTSARRDDAWIRELACHESALLRTFEKVVADLPADSALALRRQLPRLNAIHLDMYNLAGTAL